MLVLVLVLGLLLLLLLLCCGKGAFIWCGCYCGGDCTGAGCCCCWLLLLLLLLLLLVVLLLLLLLLWLEMTSYFHQFLEPLMKQLNSFWESIHYFAGKYGLNQTITDNREKMTSSL